MNINKIFKQQKQFHSKGKTLSYQFRIGALNRLEKILRIHEADIQEALGLDLNKSDFESYMTEIGFVYQEIRDMRRHLKGWMKGKYRRMPLSHFPSVGKSVAEPYGVVLVMSPWNYPFGLAMTPIIGAIAAGNCVIIKPSEYSTNVSQVISTVIGEAFPPYYIAAIQGDSVVGDQLLNLPFDYIFFTGGEAVGKIVLTKAAKHMTPVTLELGGKSPCIVDKSANIKVSARRIVFGKYINAGQTCVAPDYVLVDQEVHEELILWMKYYIGQMFGDEPLDNSDYSKIINEKHYDRIMNYITPANVVCGGYGRRESLKIAPTILSGIDKTHPVMNQEIFGPVLPVISYEDYQKAQDYILSKEKPLALYLFTKNRLLIDRVEKNISFGGGCVNDTIMHVATTKLSFGGVGHSGMGSYHGKQSFDTFSHYKSILERPFCLDNPVRYQPYSKIKSILMKRFMSL